MEEEFEGNLLQAITALTDAVLGTKEEMKEVKEVLIEISNSLDGL